MIEQERIIKMRRRRIILEIDLPVNVDIEQWHRGIVPLLHDTINGIVYIASEDVKEPDVISGYRNRSK
jgi:hypothetical protein